MAQRRAYIESLTQYKRMIQSNTNHTNLDRIDIQENELRIDIEENELKKIHFGGSFFNIFFNNIILYCLTRLLTKHLRCPGKQT
jgi:hypothetical protein